MSDCIWAICTVLCVFIVGMIIENQQNFALLKYKLKQQEKQR
jgi:hypothetical protein